ncbi:hypothetical protein BDV98DRAFT_128987 [Pterulicium gracile]|uniref:F-box domain-containing protein n=1 Tax=Pterulicium gracile TaxID=1884261 RepID=A0A5C3QIB8_9AGAR|nr:hypothetical protein BDV98DRAFT_128987 [Pterula gracilis]
MTLAPPWTLMSVCKRWRDICVAHGALWPQIHLDCKLSPREQPHSLTMPPLVPEPPYYLPEDLARPTPTSRSCSEGSVFARATAQEDQTRRSSHLNFRRSTEQLRPAIHAHFATTHASICISQGAAAYPRSHTPTCQLRQVGLPGSRLHKRLGSG